jgi:hypothetical protein
MSARITVPKTIPDTIWTWQQDQEQGDEHGNKMQQSDVLL